MLPYANIFDLSINMYKLFFYLGLLSVPIFLFALRRKFSFSKKQALFYSIFTLAFGYLSAMITAYLKRILILWASAGTYYDSEPLRNYGIPIFLPIFLFIYCVIRKDNFKKLSDYIAPCVYSVMTFVKIGCTFWGCCYGVQDDHGIWNHFLGYKTFPVQVYDALCSVGIVIVCLILIQKVRSKHEGIIYPIGGILFAVTKGFWEFFRVHETTYEKNFFNTGLTMWQYWLIVLFIGCLIWIIVTLKKEPSTKRT